MLLGTLASFFFGSRIGIAALSGLFMLIALPLAFGSGFLKGKWQTEASMISAIEKANLENEIANLKNEKKIAEDSAAQAEIDRGDLSKLVADQQVKIEELADAITKRGKGCPINPNDMCRLYGVSCDKSQGNKRKASHQFTKLSLWSSKASCPQSCGL